MVLTWPRLAFTLIKLMVVISIIVALSSMAMSMLGVAGPAARTSATKSVMAKVDTALGLFRAEIGAYPYQLVYADTSSGEQPSNRLAYQFGLK